MNRLAALAARTRWWPCLLVVLLSSASRAADVPALLKALPPRSIGPANMSGRVVEVAVGDSRPSTMYVASASGGLWKTVNNGTTWTPIFDRESTAALGAVAVSQSHPSVVWVGTGEANARNSVSWGDGVYKSIDAGKTWKNMGLRDSHHIGRIVIHPTNPDIVYVAALGRLWGPNRERGVFKTVDGGKSWQVSKYIDDNTGFVDLVMDPVDAETLYAAAYCVRRDAFSGGNPVVQIGPGAGLYKTNDGGRTWIKMTGGLPMRGYGRCGLDVCRKEPNVVYAVVQTDLTPTPVAGQGPNIKERTVTEDGKEVKRKIGPDDGGVFRSDDKGKTWTYLNSLCPRPFYYGQIRIDPNNSNRIYVMGINFHISSDGGKTFTDGRDAAKGTHADYHSLWINPRDSDHLVLGCDGGLNFSYDKCKSWEHLKNLPLGQFYAIGVDMRSPYRIYGGLQDNGSWGGPSATRESIGITISDWFNILGYDGYYCQVDPKDVDTVYAEGQYGILRRINVRTGESKDIKPRLDSKTAKTKAESNINPNPAKGTPAFRFNWSCPILLSPHDSKTVYYGANFVFRSDDRGETWTFASPDLTRGKPGPSTHTGHTITTLSESPLKPGLLYAGTDDGKVQVTRDGGRTWLDLSNHVPSLPQSRWITRVECSRFHEGTCYLSIDRHRNDDRDPYVFKTTDYGDTWRPIQSNLPAGGPVYVIKEDLRNPNLLYVGTEFALFLSLDGGGSWHRHPGLPTVPVHDLVVHPRDRELVIGTHGRSLYVMNVAPLQEVNGKMLQGEVHLFDVPPALAYRPRTFKSSPGKAFIGQNPPYGAGIYYYLKTPATEKPLVTITDAAGRKLGEYEGAKEAGLHRVTWKLQQPGKPPPKGTQAVFRPVPAGEYLATLRIGQRTWTKSIRVEAEN